MLFDSKTALITGAANRLGAEMARTLHQNGANLIIHYRASARAAKDLVDSFNNRRAGSALALQADLGEIENIERLAAEAGAAFDGLDLLINNASGFYATRFGQIDAGAWQDLVASNYMAPLFLSQACYPALKQRSGCIINMLDIYAERPLRDHSVYCSAKAANQMLVKSLALELAPEVRVNGIAPGAILWPETETSEQDRNAILDKIPLRRTGGASAITETMLYLASNHYVTGEVIHVDGGRSLSV